MTCLEPERVRPAISQLRVFEHIVSITNSASADMNVISHCKGGQMPLEMGPDVFEATSQPEKCNDRNE